MSVKLSSQTWKLSLIKHETVCALSNSAGNLFLFSVRAMLWERYTILLRVSKIALIFITNNIIILTALLIDYDPTAVVHGEYIVVFKQDTEDDESKFDCRCLNRSYWSLNVAVERYKQHVHNMAELIGINHEIRHEFSIGTSNRFRGYSAKMDDRWVIAFSKL